MEEKEENLYRRKRNIMLIGITFCIVFFLSFLSGCGVNELENQAFPLVMGVEARENESFQLYLAYPDLLNEKASEHALASDAYWEGTVTDLFEGMRQMSENSSKNPDLNHLKVLLLNPQVFASDAAMEALLSFFEKKDGCCLEYLCIADGGADAGNFHRETAVAGMYGSLSGRSAGRVGTCEAQFFCDSWYTDAAVL